MPLFRRKHKPSAAASAFRSVEHLPAATPGVYPDPDDLDRRFSVSTSREPLPPLPVTNAETAPPSNTTTSTPTTTPLLNSNNNKSNTNLPQVHHPAQYPLRRSKSQRHTSPRGNNSDDSPSWPLPNEPLQPVEPEPRKSRRSLFSLHSSAAARDQSILPRSRSVKKITGRPSPKQQRPLSIDTTSEHRPTTAWSREHELDAPWPKVPQPLRQAPPQQQQPPSQLQPGAQPEAQPGVQPGAQPQPQSQAQTPIRSAVDAPFQPQTRPQSQPQPQPQPQSRSQDRSPMPPSTGPALDTRAPRSPHPSIQRANTDSGLLDLVPRPSPVEPPRPPADLAPTQPQLDPTVGARPSSRQSLGPPSPLRPLPIHLDTMASGMHERPFAPTGQAPAQGHAPYAPEAGFRNPAGPPAAEPGRNTPISRDGRREPREETSEIDVRALVQKHDELQAKYSKVKRYYFEKEAQVQHLQNTVAHQRMAVSRTVLDDNEYANRFGRLDGAIKDLAFAIRRDWATLPSWLSGYVNDDAHTTGTKEMTAIGRAVMSRWLVEELFERYFHPALEPTFSRQLKSIEMNLRRQQVKPSTEEDKENAIARISNWRRTTLDGLTNLQGPQADEYRAQLIDQLISSLVATLVAHLREPPPGGLDNGARMIVENAVGIAEKIPLESRDVCVEYIPPGTVVQEGTMKVETGLPPLTHVRAESSGSVELDREGAAEENDEGAESGPPQREQRMRSVFSSLMGRRPGPSAPAGEPRVMEERERGPGRIRFASFVTAEVRGRGPMNVLVKAPVYMVE
ncbi:hypothetical protein BO94DRAFT_563186 [Aspergillus sclerotioniger CBS 115572]|uniref:S-adenosylmethionine-dependent methyltransferase-like protein n=1 Tax=Aspergillus sclerotioniger CBS 115572 TaxID=1450535 RepID=A0A317XAB4_9EURO|nr:hypothetical protein BO94DRAFT_563186 [Aspergillus sclerotioniger CBS 115572]PWY94582.1 hypothetical protein BO94DRAFT_563186 [Aspergillus sclerotioniger CBS 115572]